MSGFSFAVLNIPEKKYIALKSYDTHNCVNYVDLAELIDKIVANEEILQQQFESCSASIGNQLNTLTPEALYDENQAREILAFNQVLLQTENESHDRLNSIKAYNSYILPEELNRCLSKHFPNCNWIHDSTVLIESLMRQYKHEKKPCVYLSIQQNYFEMTLTEGPKLEFYNSFDYKSAADLIYYILFASEQLSLNPNEVEYKILGEIEKESEIYKLLYKYIRKLYFIERNSNYEYSFMLDEISPHFFYKLLNQHLCVS